jgi:hypothetical protein
MAELRIAHTSELGTATLACARDLLEQVFEGDFSDSDWEHALGGLHAGRAHHAAGRDVQIPVGAASY